MSSTKEITIETIRDEVHRLDPSLKETDEAFQAAVVCLSALALGNTRVVDLARFCGYRNGTVSRFVINLKASGVFGSKGRIAANWFDKDEGGVAFWMDVNVALGYVARA